MASFEDGIRDLLNASGRNFSERREDGVTVFSEDGRSFSVFAVPVSARTPEGAMERMFAVDPHTYRRTAAGKSGGVELPDGCLFFMNMGSRKYRLRTSGR